MILIISGAKSDQSIVSVSLKKNYHRTLCLLCDCHVCGATRLAIVFPSIGKVTTSREVIEFPAMDARN